MTLIYLAGMFRAVGRWYHASSGCGLIMMAISFLPTLRFIAYRRCGPLLPMIAFAYMVFTVDSRPTWRGRGGHGKAACRATDTFGFDLMKNQRHRSTSTGSFATNVPDKAVDVPSSTMLLFPRLTYCYHPSRRGLS
jgi:hypothetical protein